MRGNRGCCRYFGIATSRGRIGEQAGGQSEKWLLLMVYMVLIEALRLTCEPGYVGASVAVSPPCQRAHAHGDIFFNTSQLHFWLT